MGLIDRFRQTKQPAKTARGNSGRGHVDGYLQLEELNTDLTFPRGLQVFDQMYRTDPDVRKNVWMLVNLLAGATWTVEPYGGDEAEDRDRDAARFVEWALFQNMRPGFKGHLSQALPVLFRSGFAPFEHVWETTEWNGRQVIAPKTLGLRLPRTIFRFEQEHDQLTRIHQQLLDGSVIYPAEDLLYYRIGAEGDNWEGAPLVRAAYKPWFIKEKIEKLDAIKIEREAVGLPVCYPPQNANQEQKDLMEDIMANMRAGEQGFVMMPGPKADLMESEQAQANGWTLEVIGSDQSATADTKPSLDYHSDKIAAALLAEFMRLGQGSAPGGARATADVQQNPFLQAAEAVSGEIESVVNDQLVARMVGLNFEVEEPPRLTMSLVDSTTLEQLAGYVAKLVEKGVLHPDNDLEDFLRDRADLPVADPETRKDREERAKVAAEALQKGGERPEKGVTPTNSPSDAPVPSTVPETPENKGADKDDDPIPEPPKWGRELKDWEALMSLEEIDHALSQAQEQIQKACGTAALTYAAQSADAALDGRKKQPKPARDLTDQFTAELQRLYRTGQATVEDELDRQREYPLSAPAVSLADKESMRNLGNRAALAADSIFGRIWQQAVRAALIGSDRAEVQRLSEREAMAALKAEAQNHASSAVNLGRDDSAEAHAKEIRGARYTSILDTRRCDMCALADDDVLRPLNDPVRLSRKPPNKDCAGGGRCRCMEFYELNDEAGGGGNEPVTEPGPMGGTPIDPSGQFTLDGGTQDIRDLVENQIATIERVHKMPPGLPVTDIRIARRGPGRYGVIESEWDPINQTWLSQRITLSRDALNGTDPSTGGVPMTSTVHEIGHFLDQWSFDGTASRPVKGSYYSSTEGMREWREAVARSRAYTGLSQTSQDPGYELSWSELLARSYEQFIAERSGDAVLLAKIAARRNGNRDLYWDDADFAPISDALERLLRTRGLM